MTRPALAPLVTTALRARPNDRGSHRAARRHVHAPAARPHHAGRGGSLNASAGRARPVQDTAHMTAQHNQDNT
jgi:hypothetical protein